MLCQKCNQNEGQRYTIYYGKKIGQYSQSVMQGTQTTTTFQIGGNEVVYLCKKCTRRNPGQLLKFGALTLVVSALGFFCIYSIISPWNDMLCIPFGFVGFGLAMPWALLADKVLKNPGEVAAKEFLSVKYEDLGFDTFWNVKEYLKLKKRL